MTLKINYLDTKKILSKNTAVFLCRDAKISEFKGIFDDKTNQKLVNYIKKSKNIKITLINSSLFIPFVHKIKISLFSSYFEIMKKIEINNTKIKILLSIFGILSNENLK